MPIRRPRLLCAVAAIWGASCGGTHGSAQSASAEGTVARPPPGDRDHDGIADNADRCPAEPEDCDGFEDGDGCPEDDNDGDGVPDHCDECPAMPGAAQNPKPGCPILLVEEGPIRFLRVATFAKDSDTPVLDAAFVEQLVALINKGQLGRVGIVGHALASEKAPTVRVTARAEAVRRVLVARGAPPERIELRAAPPGNLDECPESTNGAPEPCVSFAAVEFESQRMAWNGTRYVITQSRSEPRRPFVCPPAPPRVGRPCVAGAGLPTPG